MTEWRAVPGWEKYEVSDLGHVRRDGRIMRPWKTKAGRWQIALSKNNEQKAFNIYRLVALAFLGPPPFEGAVVAHIDDNLENNAVCNLRWSTHKENCADRDRNGRTARGERNGARTKPEKCPRGERHGHAKLTELDVKYIRAQAQGSVALARQFNVSYALIKMVRRGQIWRHV
jgi:hypothetical protein